MITGTNVSVRRRRTVQYSQFHGHNVDKNQMQSQSSDYTGLGILSAFIITACPVFGGSGLRGRRAIRAPIPRTLENIFRYWQVATELGTQVGKAPLKEQF